MNPWLVMVLGMTTVFVGLISLILLTKLMSAVVNGKKKRNVAKSAASEQPALAPAAPLAIADRRAFDAAVAAAIATYLGTDVSGLRIHSVKQISGARDRGEFVSAVAASIAAYMDKDVKGLRIKSIKQI